MATMAGPTRRAFAAAARPIEADFILPAARTLGPPGDDPHLANPSLLLKREILSLFLNLLLSFCKIATRTSLIYINLYLDVDTHTHTVTIQLYFPVPTPAPSSSLLSSSGTTTR